MSYAKKDEDADHSSFKLDRTSVFQDGTITTLPRSLLLCLEPPTNPLYQHDSSTPLPYHLENAGFSSPNWQSYCSPAKSSLQMKPPLYSLVFRNCSKTKTRPSAKWCI